MVKIPLLSRIFVWSIVFELLYFFTIPILGQRPEFSRFLQVIVLIGLLIKWLRFSRLNDLKIVNINHPIYRYYSFYFGLVVLAGIIGIFSGAYSVDFVNNLNERHTLRTSISPIENMAIEYLIALYYFSAINNLLGPRVILVQFMLMLLTYNGYVLFHGTWKSNKKLSWIGLGFIFISLLLFPTILPVIFLDTTPRWGMITTAAGMALILITMSVEFISGRYEMGFPRR